MLTSHQVAPSKRTDPVGFIIDACDIVSDQAGCTTIFAMLLMQEQAATARVSLGEIATAVIDGSINFG